MSSTFDELSQEMSSDQKKELLGRIQLSLNLSARDTDNIVSKAEDAQELKHRLTREVEKLGAIDRFFLRVSAFFLSRSETEIMADRRLAGSRTVLRDRIPEMVNFSHQEWTPEFGKLVYDVFCEISELKPVFEHLFQQKLTLEAGLLLLLQEEFPEAARELDSLFPERDMVALYKTDQKRSNLQASLDQRLTSYFEKIPSSVFERVRDTLRPLYYLRPLIQFPYIYLLEQFGHNPEKAEVTKYPFMIGAPWTKSAGLLERLYYGLYLSTKIEWRETSLNQIFHGVADRLSNDKVSWTAEGISQKVSALVRVAQETAQRVPWKEVLQWSFQDPYYSVKYILPKYSVRDFYETTLTLNFDEELAEKIPEMRRRLLAEEKMALFERDTFQPLDYYISGAGSSISPTIRVQGFQHTETLGLLWALLSHHFTKRVQPFHQSLSRLVAPASKSSLAGLANVIEELSQLKSRIYQFDRSLHPDAEEGKEFQKLKYELASKPFGLKPFVQLVQNKDDQALELINRGQEGFQTLLTQFSGIRDRNVPALKAILGLPYLLDGRQETVENGLDRMLVVLRKALFVLKEASNLES